jgi:hypothetical protein
MKKQSSRRPPPSRSKRKKLVTPEQIRTYIKDMYDARQGEWSSSLLHRKIDWSYLLGLHLQMMELEHLQSKIEEQAQ